MFSGVCVCKKGGGRNERKEETADRVPRGDTRPKHTIEKNNHTSGERGGERPGRGARRLRTPPLPAQGKTKGAGGFWHLYWEKARQTYKREQVVR